MKIFFIDIQVPDIESPRPKSVPSSPMVKRAFSRLGTITAGWGRSIRKHNTAQLSAEDKKKWASSHDCSSKFRNYFEINHFNLVITQPENINKK